MNLEQLNRTTLLRQGLLEPLPLDPVGALGVLGPLQAQDPAGVWLALSARLASFDPSDLDRAFETGTLVRAQLLRITLHALRADDYPTFWSAMAPSLRGSRVHDRRFAETGLTPATAARLETALEAFCHQPRSADEIRAFLAAEAGTDHARVWWALRTFAPLVQRPDGSPWGFGEGRLWVSGLAGAAVPHEEAVTALVRRYLGSFGPAGVEDVCRFTLLRAPVVKAALRALGAEVVAEQGPQGPLFDLVGASRARGDELVPVRLLPMWDQTLLAYSEPDRMYAPGVRRRVAQVNGDILPTVLVDGRVQGVWRTAGGRFEVATFRPLSQAEWDGVEVEARRIRSVLADRDPDLYRRTDHWWAKGLGGETFQRSVFAS